MSTATQEKTQNKELFSLWKKESRSGNGYFTGRTVEKENLVAFYNTNKKNPKEPDLRVYIQAKDNKEENIPYASLWCNLSKADKKYLVGKTEDGKNIVGFFNNGKNEKAPYLRVYLKDELKKEEVKQEVKAEVKAEAKPKKEEKPEVKAGKKPLPF